MPDDERKGRRLGDETKGRIASLASGWTVEGDSPPAPEVPEDREASGRVRNAARRKAKTLPPPPPGSPERKARENLEELESRERRESIERERDGSVPEAEPIEDRGLAKAKGAGRVPPPVPAARPRTATQPLAGKPRAKREVLDLTTIPEIDKTQENRGAVGNKHDKSSLTANAASGTIGGDTPLPRFDRGAIAAGAKGTGSAMTGGASVARGTPTHGADPHAPRPDAPRAGLVLPTTPATPSGGVVVDGRIRDAVPELIESGPQRSKDRSRPAPRAPVAGGPPLTESGPPAPQLAVPVGEFEHGATVLEEDKIRIAHAQATIKRDAASALLGLAAPAPAASKPLVTSVVMQDIAVRARGGANATAGSSTGRLERGDPTALDDDREDATTVAPPSARHAPAGTLRSSAALRRKRGLAGDVRYLATVVFGLRAARRELAALEARQVTRRQSRRHHLVTLGRAAVISEGFFHPELGPAREQLATIEEERSQHAGHVVAADAELTRVRRDREAQARQYLVDLAALDSELAGHARQLEPLEKDAARIRRRAADLHESLRRIDAKIAATEASLSSARDGKLDRAAVQAELATLRAERHAILRDEPVIAGELDAISPRIAAIEAARAEAQRKRAELQTSEQDDQRRVEELLAAIGAKRKVVDRAAADAEALRDKILFRLGERLCVDRPDDLTAQLAPIDDIDVELGVDDRRAMELREILSSVDRRKVARGVALLTVLVGALAALAGWLVIYRPL